jgi:hypothetical protein
VPGVAPTPECRVEKEVRTWWIICDNQMRERAIQKENGEYTEIFTQSFFILYILKRSSPKAAAGDGGGRRKW